MHLFTLVAFLTLAGSPNRPIPAGCSEDYGTCREDCTIEFGGSTTKYRQLGECLRSCDKAQTECTRQHYALRDALPEPLPSSSSSGSPSVPASGTEPTSSSGRRDVYRATEAEPARPPEPPAPPPAPVEPPVKKEPEPEPQPAAPSKPAPEPEKLEMRTFDDDEPEPAPAPKPAPKPIEPPRSQPPPEPKKKDISEWDPNGD